MELDTIAAIATAPGASGVGIVRVSGPDAVTIAARLARTRPPLEQVPSHTVRVAWLRDAEGRRLDEALVTVMRGPRTYTGEDIVELGVHGGAVPARRVLRAVLAAGARAADRGEFTRRAFVHGRIDLSRAEAVADVIAARTERGADVALAALAGGLARRTEVVESALLDALARIEASLDFTEDVGQVPRGEIAREIGEARAALAELRRRVPWGRRLREGASVVLVGAPNAGKSSLFNALLEDDRALVSPTPGTTRDVLEAWIDVEGVPVRLVDTAGMRETARVGENAGAAPAPAGGRALPDGGGGAAAIEAAGVERAGREERRADLRLVVHDSAAPWTTEDEAVARRTAGTERIRVASKADLPAASRDGDSAGEGASGGPGAEAEAWVRVSAHTGEGLPRIRAAIAERLLGATHGAPEDDVAPTERHDDALRRADDALAQSEATLAAGGSEELVASDLREAAEALGEITGKTVREEVLDRIFSRFCIGK